MISSQTLTLAVCTFGLSLGLVTAPAAGQDANPVATKSLETNPSGEDKLHAYLDARCISAFCMYGNWLGIEPLVELPVGKSFALGSGSLNDHVNNFGFKVELAAGLRVWLFRDFLSFAVYLSTPLSSERVRLAGIPTSFPSSSIHRTYPGIAIGILYDTIWIGFDHDELRNGDGSESGAYSPLFAANSVIAGATVVTVAIQPITAVRALFGTLGTKGAGK